MRVWLGLIGVALLAPGVARAGVIAGRVVDPHETPIMLVTVVATPQPGAGVAIAEFTDTDGRYTLRAPPGTYDLLFIYGDAKHRVPAVVVRGNETITVNATLEFDPQDGVTICEDCNGFPIVFSSRQTVEEIEWDRRFLPSRAVTIGGIVAERMHTGSEDVRVALAELAVGAVRLHERFFPQVSVALVGHDPAFAGPVATAPSLPGGMSFSGAIWAESHQSGMWVGGPLAERVSLLGGAARVGDETFHAARAAVEPWDGHQALIAVDGSDTTRAATATWGSRLPGKTNLAASAGWFRADGIDRRAARASIRHHRRALGFHSLEAGGAWDEVDGWAGYVRDQFTPVYPLNLELGLRVDEVRPQPRLGAAWDFLGGSRSVVFAGWSRLPDSDELAAGVRVSPTLSMTLDATYWHRGTHDVVQLAAHGMYSDYWRYLVSYSFEDGEHKLGIDGYCRLLPGVVGGLRVRNQDVGLQLTLTLRPTRLTDVDLWLRGLDVARDTRSAELGASVRF